MSSEVPLESPEYDNVEERLNHINQEEAVDTEEHVQGDEEEEYANDGAGNAEAENAADYEEAAAWNDDGYASATPLQPNHEDSSWWDPYIDIETLQQTTAQEYGAFIGGGTVLAWRGNNTGKSVIVGYRCDGKIIGRLEAAGRRRVDTSEGGHAHISTTCRGKKKIPGTDDYWSQEYISGMGTVAWRVEPDYAEDPTSVLIPMNKAWYPETYVGVIWCDSMYTWESRDCLRFIMGSKNYETDIAIYRLAISQDGDYQEVRTGTRPWYPNPGERPNQHWRNINAIHGAFWKQPRARKNSRVVSIQEIPVNEEGEENTEENAEEEMNTDEEANTEDDIEGEEFEHHAEDEIQEEPEDRDESRGHWQSSGTPPPYMTPAASREGSAIPGGRRPQGLPRINEDEEFHTPYTPHAFNNRYRSRSGRDAHGSQHSTPARGSRAASGSQVNTPSRPPSVTPMRGSRGASVSQRDTPNRQPSGSQGSTPTPPTRGSPRGVPGRPPPGSQRGTSNRSPSMTQGSTANAPPSGSQRGTPNRSPSATQGSRSTRSQPPSEPPRRTPGRPTPGSQRGTSNRSPSTTQGSTPNAPQSGSPRGSSGSQRGTPNRSPSATQGSTRSQPQSELPRRTPGRPTPGPGDVAPSQHPFRSRDNTPTQPLSSTQRDTPRRPPPGSQRGTPNQPPSGSQGNTPRQSPSDSRRGTPNQSPGSQRGTPVRGSQPPSGHSNRHRPASAQSSSDPIAQPREPQRSSNRTGNGRRGQRQNPHRQARRPNTSQ